MRKIRINNEFTHHWAIVLENNPINLTSLPKRLYLSHPREVKEIEKFKTTGNVISVDFTKYLLNKIGVYSLELYYEIPDLSRENGVRQCAVDTKLCQIVETTAEADEVAEFSTTSDMAFGFKGLSAYEVWHETHEGTLEDYENWLQKPATDAVSLIEDKIETLDTAIQQEEQRELAEGVRLSNEQSRVEAEGQRVTAESNRNNAESARNNAESDRNNTESDRNSAENIRKYNEQERIDAEESRVTAEENRQSNEGDRIENEVIRVQNEAERISKENVRQSDEIDRVEDEGVRVEAENERVQAESERVQAEIERVEAENERAQAEIEREITIQEAVTATQEATTAASLADTARLAILNDLALKQNKTDSKLQTTSKSVVGAINEVNKIVSIHHADNRAVRRWDNTLSTPIGEAVGDIAFLRELPRILGLGCYLVEDDLTMRKLHRDNHNFYEDGTPALLDGTEGQYMFCWNAFYYTNWEEDGFEYEAISLQPIIGKKSYFIPGGGYSAIGHGVIDRDTLTLCSVVNSEPRYRGGNNTVIADTLAGANDPQTTMLGMPATVYGIHTALAYARKRGDQWSACWFVARSAVEILISIIYGNRHTQSAVLPKDANGLYQGGFGAGLTAMPDWSGFNGTYPLIPTNAGVELGDLCGSFDYTIPKADGTAYHVTGIPSFFGLKNFFGHLWFGVAGLTINAGQTITEAYVMPSMYGGWDHNSLGGMLKAAELPRSNGYIGKLSMNLLCALPIELGASASTKYADYFYENTAGGSYGFRARWGGGSVLHGTYAGAFCTYSNSTATTAGAYRSVPLCFFKEDPIIE